MNQVFTAESSRLRKLRQIRMQFKPQYLQKLKYRASSTRSTNGDPSLQRIYLFIHQLISPSHAIKVTCPKLRLTVLAVFPQCAVPAVEIRGRDLICRSKRRAGVPSVGLGVFSARRGDSRLRRRGSCWVTASGCCRSGVTGGGSGNGSGIDGGQSGSDGGSIVATGCGSITRAHAVIIA